MKIISHISIMNALIVIVTTFVFAAQAAPSLNFDCPSICADIWAPVCAFNGRCHQTFGSSCDLAAENCHNRDRSDEQFHVKYDGECSSLKGKLCSESNEETTTEEAPITDVECPQICTFIYNPVCAFNGDCYETFPSPCVLEASNCLNKSESKFKQISFGDCEETKSKICLRN